MQLPATGGQSVVCSSVAIDAATASARHRSADRVALHVPAAHGGSLHLIRSCLEVEAPKAANLLANPPIAAGLAAQPGSPQKNPDISEAADNRRLGLDLAAALLSAAQALHGEIQENGAQCNVEPRTSGSETALRTLQLSIEEQQRQQHATLISIAAHWEERMAHMERAITGGLESAAAATAEMQARSQYFMRVADVLEDAVREAVRTAISVAGSAQDARQADQVGSSDEQSEHLQQARGAPLHVAAMCDRISRELRIALPQSPRDTDPLLHRDCFGSDRDQAAGQSPVMSGTVSSFGDAGSVKESGSSSGGALQQSDEVVRRLELLSKELHGGLLHSAAKHSPPASLTLPDDPRGLCRSFAPNGSSGNSSGNNTARGAGKTRVIQQHAAQTSQSPEGGSDASIGLEGFAGKNRGFADTMSNSTAGAGEGLVEAMARLVGLNSPGH